MEQTIAERYELESKLGSGGMGTVWRATDRLLGRTVAVKRLHEGLAEDAAFAERFRREARSAAKLGHPNIVTVYDTGEDAGTPFIVMEYVEGESLSRMLHEHGPLPVEDTARIARSVLAALAHAHERGLVHRDMKPANVLFDAATKRAKVVDFGIAKGLDDTAGLTRTSGLIGTAAYLSPEQVSGGEATFSSDLYAVGCLLYCCLAGEPPFGGPTPVAIAMRHLNDAVPPLRHRRPDVPAQLDAAIERALHKDPARRFASAADMDQAIAATGLDSRAARDPVVSPHAPQSSTTVAMRRHPVGGAAATEVIQRRGSTTNRWLAVITAFLLAAAAGAVAVLYLQSREPDVLQVPLPLDTPAPSVVADEPEATPEPTPSPDVTPQAPATPQGPILQLPGLGAGRPSDPPPEPDQTPAAPTEEP